MKKEYDFSNGERGKFYNKDVNFNFPIFLEPDVRKYVEEIATRKKKNVGTIVNSIIKKNMQLAKVLN
jgi:hypothetical protein